MSKNIEILCDKLSDADAVLIGAGAGLSASAGFDYSGERFEKYFSDFIEKYRFKDMYIGGFYHFKTKEEFWAYWSRYIYINRYMDAPKNTYSLLKEIVKDKDYFVITTNVDHCFQKAGFDKHKLFYTQGDYGLFQCSQPCHDKTYDNEEQIAQMLERQQDMKIPGDLLPKCPVCGKDMTMNLCSDGSFVEDEGWHKAQERYADFLRRHKGLEMLYLEIGVGMNTPSIIKYPLWKMTYQNGNSYFVSINFGEAYAPKEIEKRSLCINCDIHETLNEALKQKNGEKCD